MVNSCPTLFEAVTMLVKAADKRGRNLQMPGEPKYQPNELKPYLGYDQRVGWQILVEWFWMETLSQSSTMPAEHAALLTPKLLDTMLQNITETKVANLERTKTHHDILALLELMRRYLPKTLHRYLHLGLTSYDVVCTANALQLRWTFNRVFRPQIVQLDKLWRQRIEQQAAVVRSGRTHLQVALPVTMGSWLAVLHSRFAGCSQRLASLTELVTGKFSGAVGTKAALLTLAKQDLESLSLQILGLPQAKISTQIVQPEDVARYYSELGLLSAALSNLGDDVRHLQASGIEEVTSASSTSSTMAHKINPVAAENLDGMNVHVRCDVLKVIETTNSTLERDLRYSNVIRSYPSVMVFCYQQLKTADRLFKTFQVDQQRCLENLQRTGKLMVAELLHLSLQLAGYPQAHQFVNQKIVPQAKRSGRNLREEMEAFLLRSRDKRLHRSWQEIPAETKEMLTYPANYLGSAIQTAREEADNVVKL